MTNETEYGPEIVVDGVRPEWLRDDEMVPVRGYRTGAVEVGEHVITKGVSWLICEWIRLPASHGYYTVLNHNAKHGTQFKYWPGGPKPADWDGGGVLYRDGQIEGRVPVRWHNYDELLPSDIIGYTPKPGADSVGNTDVTPQPDFVPCERTVRLCIEKVRNAFDSRGQLTKMDSVFVDGYRTGLDALEALLLKKDRAEELVEAWNEVVSFDRLTETELEGFKSFTRWLVSRGYLP